MRRFLALILTILTAVSLAVPLPVLAAEGPAADFDGYLVRLNETGEADSLTLLGTDSCSEVSDGLCLVEDLDTVQAMDQLGLVE